MAVKLTTAQARTLGLEPGSAGADSRPAPPTTRRRPRTAPGPYRTSCHGCGAVFTTRAAETRHVAPGHVRFDVDVTKGNDET